ncbi:Bifunctional dethiobiotin synthetase/7,8-diamino-pelargonic acid aminotransferase, mitochondrial [Purpureocillium lavendulum]|uniref:Bifunctional dethiobiotin synthetase/7,8-diamino-pelargonic acid aminotransferase, mitochondrial n=1 Tax=Purpureocillium lavendulum TaxID=1247861 RepID=A0AB34FNQ9_9HYPO|nr:Bifunctional dethiobiotin synthetase/7,8-diamino-pelargonic acid aminotransferase, mitochondrial [Purpureocillium lavendulum]
MKPFFATAIAFWTLNFAEGIGFFRKTQDTVKPPERAYILQSNDDGWAELNIRLLNDALIAKGHHVFLCAPAEDKSGWGPKDPIWPEPPIRSKPCHYNSCPADTGENHGFNETRSDLCWVNSYARSAVRIGLRTYAKRHWGEDRWADLVVTGPNVGTNLGHVVQWSSTCQAAIFAAAQDIPAIAFSVADNQHHAWNVQPVPEANRVYAELAAMITQKIIDGGKPYLRYQVFVNVNFPKSDTKNNRCTKVSDFKFIFTRMEETEKKKPDVAWCGTRKLPVEKHVVHRQDGCFVSITPGSIGSRTMGDTGNQKDVLNRLKSILSCLPPEKSS